MFDVVRKEIEWGGRPLVFETGRVARQADGAVLVTYGETTALCTVVGAKEPRVGLDFFPLTVMGSPFSNPMVINVGLFGDLSGETVL